MGGGGPGTRATFQPEEASREGWEPYLLLAGRLPSSEAAPHGRQPPSPQPRARRPCLLLSSSLGDLRGPVLWWTQLPGGGGGGGLVGSCLGGLGLFPGPPSPPIPPPSLQTPVSAFTVSSQLHGAPGWPAHPLPAGPRTPWGRGAGRRPRLVPSSLRGEPRRGGA